MAEVPSAAAAPGGSPAVEPALLIVNTRSRVGAAHFERARGQLTVAEVPLADAVALEEPARLVGIIEAAVGAGVRRFFVGGGDGTVNAAANVLAGTGLTLGVIPCGTGNDFARSLRIPLGVEDACELLRAGPIREVDLGRVEGSYFLNAVSVGITSEIHKNVNPAIKHRLGKIAYATAAASEALKLTPFKAQLRTEDSTRELECAQVVVGNGRYHGGGSLIAPDAGLDDRLLDVYAIVFEGGPEDEKLRLRDLLTLARIAMMVRRGRHIEHPAVQHFRTRRLQLTTSPPLDLDVDGEVFGTTPVSFEVAARALKVIAPAPPRRE